MKYTLAFRIWHWLNALVVLGLIGTIILRKSFLSWCTNSEIIMQKMSEFGVAITQDQAIIIAKAIRAGMWEWHIILGYALAFLILWRIWLYFSQEPQKESFSTLSLHKKGVRISYCILYASLGFMALSGLIIHFYAELSLSKEIAHDIKEIHEVVFYAVALFVPLHIAGVFIAENRDEPGLISTMVNGKVL